MSNRGQVEKNEEEDFIQQVEVPYVEPGMFCEVNCEDFKGYDIEKGDMVYIAGDAMVRTSEVDPYVFRRLFVANYVVDDGVDVSRKPFMIDGGRLNLISDEENARLKKIFDNSMAGEVSAEGEAVQ